MVLTSVLVLLVLLALSVPVAAVLGVLGLILGEVYSFMPLTRAIGVVSWSASQEFVLFTLPLFVLMGEILLRSGIAERMYTAMIQWVSWLPGGLMHSNIGACTLFAASCGSSFATAATIGTVALTQVRKYGYNESLFCGSLASGGTLGILIPPSGNLIIYGVLTNTSIPQLYLAGFVPGLVLAGLFMLTILVLCIARPSLDGRRIATTWAERWRSLPDLLPPIMIFLLVVVSIYAGLATPTESAALGVLGALALAAARRRLGWDMMRQVVEATMRITAMGLVIIMAAFYLNFAMSFVGLTGKVTSVVTALGLGPYGTLTVIIVFYLILGMFMETLSMMIATVPIVTPIVLALGFDPVWFGILIVLLIETAMITPPVGTNLFIIQGVRGRGHLHEVIIGSSPFVVTLIAMIVLIVVFPDIALWLPRAFS